MKHLLSIADLSREGIDHLISRAASFQRGLDGRHLCRNAAGRVMASLFFETSTRTRFGFEIAMRRLGGDVVSSTSSDSRSGGSSHGSYVEPLEDAARSIGQMADIIVVRHPEPGTPRRMSEVAGIPVVNAGDGMGPGSEHPAQVLGDLYTISREFGRIDDLSILIAGSLQFRAAHSLMLAMTKLYGIRLAVLCPDEYFWSDAEEAAFRAAGGSYRRVETIAEAAPEADIIYHNGFSEDQMPTPLFQEASVSAMTMRFAKPSSIVMHPLPRDFEVGVDVDGLPQARYFEQVKCGIPMRMAILDELLATEIRP